VPAASPSRPTRQLRDRGIVALQLRPHVVQRGLADEARLEQRLLPTKVRRGKLARGLRLAQLLGDRLDFGRALSGSQIGQPCFGRLQLLLGLAARREFIFAFQRKQRTARSDIRAALHRKLLQRARERSGDSHVLAFDVALQRPLGRRSAGGETQAGAERDRAAASGRHRFLR
jgi:hypothetical protein